MLKFSGSELGKEDETFTFSPPISGYMGQITGFYRAMFC